MKNDSHLIVNITKIVACFNHKQKYLINVLYSKNLSIFIKPRCAQKSNN